MATALQDTPVSYEDLADIEKDFEDVDTEILRQQLKLTAPIYERRQKIISQIPNFWPLVLEQAPPDIDQYIQPSDSALLLSSLTSLSISRFQESDSSNEGSDPRSFSIKLDFAENEYFEDTQLEKKFWHRRAKDGWSGYVSEPVAIKWKADKDLTEGLLDLVRAAWEAENASEKQQAANGEAKKMQMSPEQNELKLVMDKTGMGGLSFFAWFGFIGRRITAEESAEATKLEVEKRQKRKQGEKVEVELDDESLDESELDDDMGMSLEIFPDGDELAIAFKEDLWPDAIKYFTQAQEQDALSDADFESDDDELTLEEIMEFDSDGNPPAKKQKI